MQQFAALLNGLALGKDSRTVSSGALLAVFAATMFLSALLLFSVQPLFAKMALPALGGTPAVWAVSMCFFQAALLGGYIYAHALNRRLPQPRAVLAHILLLASAALILPIGLPALANEPPAGDAYLWLLTVLALGVGLPFFAVSATAPLLQAWFSKSGHPDAADPYFLYGASNFGSLLALLAYPIVIEPNIGLASQSTVWSFGFFILAALIALCGRSVFASSASTASAHDRAPPAAKTIAAPISIQTRVAWMALAAIPSGLMVAVTTYVTTDVASAPFIWVIPLALFLTTFILVFKDRLGFNYAWVINLLPVAILVHILMPSHLVGVISAVIAFLLAAIVCHRELYLARPDASRLTEFYICMSAGGVIGGIFSAMIAPQMFASVVEFKLLLLLALLARPGMLDGTANKQSLLRLSLFSGGMAGLFAGYKWLESAGLVPSGSVGLAALIALALLAVFLTRPWAEHRIAIILTMFIGLAVMPADLNTIYSERSFFGTIRVMEAETGQHHLMLHGTTIHGAERNKTADGKPVQKPVPSLYYYPGSPMHQGAVVSRAINAASGQPLSVGIVGLGTGAMSCYAEPGESWRYFEIDPMVARVAQNPALFTYLSRCPPSRGIVFGDARITLTKEHNASLNYLLIDAFSSDAIPVHLLTQESMHMYLDKIVPDGLIAIHISNRFMDLAPAISATAETLGLKGLIVMPLPKAAEPDAAQSRVVYLTRNEATLTALKRVWPEGKALDAEGVQPWTDDYSDILSTLIPRRWR